LVLQAGGQAIIRGVYSLRTHTALSEFKTWEILALRPKYRSGTKVGIGLNAKITRDGRWQFFVLPKAGPLWPDASVGGQKF